jgi:hypothetical protein
MRTIIVSLCVVLSTVAATAQTVPGLRVNMPYSQARGLLMHEAWSPDRIPATERETACPDLYERCTLYPEASECSGTGRGLCIFRWRKAGQRIEIMTQGEDGFERIINIRRRG